MYNECRLAIATLAACIFFALSCFFLFETMPFTRVTQSHIFLRSFSTSTTFIKRVCTKISSGHGASNGSLKVKREVLGLGLDLYSNKIPLIFS